MSIINPELSKLQKYQYISTFLHALPSSDYDTNPPAQKQKAASKSDSDVTESTRPKTMTKGGGMITLTLLQ